VLSISIQSKWTESLSFYSIQGEAKMEKSRKNQGKRNRSQPDDGCTKQMKRDEQTVSS
jgi:hypothetical protein